MAAPMKQKMKLFFIYAIFSFFFADSTSSTKLRRDIFSTKTPYRWLNNVNTEVNENEFMTTKFEGHHCVAIQSQTFLRHGARFPGVKDIRKMTELHLKLKLSTTNKEFEFLKSWENRFSENEEKRLVDEGEDEQYWLGGRMAKRLSKLFDGQVEGVKFVSSSKDRCVHSAHAFYEGFTEHVVGEAEENLVPIIDDKIMRFHTLCRKYIDAVDNNRTHLKMYKDFKTHPQLLQVVDNVKKRLGIQHAEIDAGDIKLMYFLCTFELTSFEEHHWCDLLSEEERTIMEYHNDLKQYWKKAYGHDIIGKMACPLTQTLFRSLDKAVDNALNNMNKRGSVATFYFGHSETLAPLYASLGLFNDSQPLLATNFDDMKSRKFKSTYILPFSANLALILYKCDYEHQPGPSVDDYVLRLFVNEQPVEIPGCDDYVCPYKMVRDRYSESVDGCNFDSVCENVHDEL